MRDGNGLCCRWGADEILHALQRFRPDEHVLRWFVACENAEAVVTPLYEGKLNLWKYTIQMANVVFESVSMCAEYFTCDMTRANCCSYLYRTGCSIPSSIFFYVWFHLGYKINLPKMKIWSGAPHSMCNNSLFVATLQNMGGYENKHRLHPINSVG
jgi:hypothetical protein